MDNRNFENTLKAINAIIEQLLKFQERMQKKDLSELRTIAEGIFDIECTSENYHFEELRINHLACEEVKVVYNEKYEEYENVVKTKDGAVYYVQL